MPFPLQVHILGYSEFSKTFFAVICVFLQSFRTVCLLFHSFRVIYVITKEAKEAFNMEIRCNVTGARRKELAETVGGILGWAPVYKGAPSFAYAVANVTISKDGTLSLDACTDEATAGRLLEGLRAAGFTSDDPAVGMPFDAGEHMENIIPDSLTIELPLDGFNDAALTNLDRLIASKAALIKKAIGADALPVERTETTLRFPWFRFDASPEEVSAYTQFIGALCAAAKEQHRVTAKEKPVENEKFAFRIFLIRLGFVGDDYKAARKVLLKSLTGNTAFKNGAPRKAAEAPADE